MGIDRGAPSGNGYTKIYSTESAFAALKADGSIIAWGFSFGSSGAPSDNGYTKIYSTAGCTCASVIRITPHRD
jgi:hypothetical protein